MVKNLPAVQETWVQSMGWEDPLEKWMATHSSILAWRISWTEGLVSYCPWGHKELDRTEWLLPSLLFIGIISTASGLRTYTMGGSLKGWGTKYGLQALHSSGRSWELEVPSWLYGTVCVWGCGLGWGGVGFVVTVCLSLSYPFQGGHLFICWRCRSHSASFRISFRNNCSLLPIWCVHRMMGVQGPLCHHLGQAFFTICYIPLPQGNH